MTLYILNNPVKIKRNVSYVFDNEHVRIKIQKNAILLPIYYSKQEKQVGWLLNGKFSIDADLLVHTKSGIAGKIVQDNTNFAILMPPILDFLSFTNLKEVKPINDIEIYAKKIEEFNKKLASLSFLFHPVEHTYIWTLEQNNFWLITKNKTLYINLPEVLARTGEDNLIWVRKAGLLVAKNKEKIISNSDLKAGKTIREFIKELFNNLNIDEFLRNFNLLTF